MQRIKCCIFGRSLRFTTRLYKIIYVLHTIGGNLFVFFLVADSYEVCWPICCSITNGVPVVCRLHFLCIMSLYIYIYIFWMFFPFWWYLLRCGFCVLYWELSSLNCVNDTEFEVTLICGIRLLRSKILHCRCPLVLYSWLRR